MNLALQTRRAVITLGLMALAIVCVAAKATRIEPALSAEAPARVEALARQTLDVSAGPVVGRIAEPVTVAVAKRHGVRCGGKSVRI